MTAIETKNHVASFFHDIDTFWKFRIEINLFKTQSYFLQLHLIPFFKNFFYKDVHKRNKTCFQKSHQFWLKQNLWDIQ